MPEQEQRTITIDGHAYEVKLLDAYSAVPVWHKVAKVIVAAFDAIGSSSAGVAALMSAENVSDVAILGKLATRAAQAALKEMDPAELRVVIDAFAGVTTLVTGGDKNPVLKGVVAVHFAGRLASLAKWLAFCVEVNFGDFLELARGMMASAQKRKSESDAAKAAQAAATSPSASPATSTG